MDAELERLCNEAEVDPKGIIKLINYYTKHCGWTESKASDYIKELFRDGTIIQIKELFGE